MLKCIILYTSSKIYWQCKGFPDKVKILVKSKKAAILAVILGDVTGHQQYHTP